MDTFKRLPGTPDPMHLWKSDDGLSIAGDAWGDPGDPLVLLLHGICQTRHAWGDTGKRLGDAGYYAVSYDARGHGDSDWSPEGDYSRDAMIRDLKSIIARLGGRTPILAGASMGGITSLIGIGENHLEAEALILVDITPHTEPKGIDRIHSFMSRHGDGFDSLEAVAEAIQSYRPREQRTGKLDGLAKNVRLGPNGRYYWHWDPKINSRVRDTVERRANSAKTLTLPTLLIRGAKSDVITEDNVQQFMNLCPHSEYINIADGRHMLVGDKNDVFGIHLIDFIKKTKNHIS